MQTKSKQGSYAKRAIKYANDIIAEKIPSGRYVKLAAQRLIDDINAPEWTFDHSRVDHVCHFAENMPHVKAEWSGELLKLEPWQIFILACLFGVISTETKLRKYREAYICIPRKNGKSTIAGIIGNYMTFADGEAAAETYSGATKEKQALEVFRSASRMAKASPDFVRAFDIEFHQKSIYSPVSGSFFQIVTGDPGEGQSPHCWILDEYHEAHHARQYSAAKTGRGARRQPMSPLVITTAGTNLAGPCHDLQRHAQDVLEGNVSNDPLFAIIFGIDAGDSFRDWSSWVKANPNFGVSASEEYLRGQYEEALTRPSMRAEMRTKHLNEWVSSASAWLDGVAWADSAADAIAKARGDDKPMTLASLKGRSAYIALDLASKTDLCAVAIVIPLDDGRYFFQVFFFVPEGALERSKNSAAYEHWRDQGHLIVTPGNATDFAEVEGKVIELASEFRVENVLFDQFQAEYMRQRIESAGLKTTDFPQRAITYSPVMKDFEADLLNRLLIHDNNPVMNWCAGNVCAKYISGTLYTIAKPDKQDHLKIDGIAALLMAYGGASEGPAAPLPKVQMFVLD